MTPSSSSSWAGAGGAGADIIDLDQYMRGHVRPSRALSEEKKLGEQLVVDGGGIGRKLTVDTTSVRYKRYSQDSGVSDGSYVQQRVHRPHRRASNPDGPRRELIPVRSADPPSNSLQEFRKTCEQALIDQQKQIARVTQLCELLTERAEKVTLPEKIQNNEPANDLANTLATVVGRPTERPTVVKQAKPAREHIARKAERVSSDTSDISTSSCSRSTKDLSRKEKHRKQECKTYKIIMTKLDELNRRFVPPHPARPRPRPRAPSSTSVSVCDKLVATDPQRTVDKVLWPTNTNFPAYRRQSSIASSRPRVVTEAYNVDIAPKANVITESVIKCASSCGSATSIVDPRCGFDLEDPVHLYSQVKRLQALNATTRRVKSVATRSHRSLSASDPRTNASKSRLRSPSLCAVCRGYWRTLRQCLTALFAQECTA